jgi:hypothetical protein
MANLIKKIEQIPLRKIVDRTLMTIGVVGMLSGFSLRWYNYGKCEGIAFGNKVEHYWDIIDPAQKKEAHDLYNDLFHPYSLFFLFETVGLIGLVREKWRKSEEKWQEDYKNEENMRELLRINY